MRPRPGGGQRGPVRARISVVEPSMSAIEGFRAICLACLAHLEANREGVLAGSDPEYLHQMRVALRRLRSAFSVYRRLLPRTATARPLEEIRWLLGVLGPARDWDVFLQATLAPLSERWPQHRGLAALARACRRRRGAALGAARRALASARYARMLPDLRAWLAAEPWTSLLPLDEARALRQPAREYATAALARRHRQVRRRGRGLARLDAAALHRLRIAVKKMRYTVNFFAALFPRRRVAALAAPLEQLQEILGAMNDCATAARLAGEAGAAARAAGVRQAEALLGEANQRALAAQRGRLRPAWKAFRAARRFWKE